MNRRRLIAAVMGGTPVFDPMTLSPAVWLKADAGTFQVSDGTTPATANGDKVGYWGDQSGNGKHATQASAGDRPALNTNVLNGLPGINFDAAKMVFSPGLSAGSFSIYMIGKPLNAGTDLFLIDAETGRLIISTNSNTGKIGWYDGNWKNTSSDPVAEWQVLTWILTSGGNGEIFKNGLSLGTNAYTSKAMGGTVGFASGYSGSNRYGGSMVEMLIFTGAHTAIQRAQVESYLAHRSGINF